MGGCAATRGARGRIVRGIGGYNPIFRAVAERFAVGGPVTGLPGGNAPDARTFMPYLDDYLTYGERPEHRFFQYGFTPTGEPVPAETGGAGGTGGIGGAGIAGMRHEGSGGGSGPLRRDQTAADYARQLVNRNMAIDPNPWDAAQMASMVASPITGGIGMGVRSALGWGTPFDSQPTFDEATRASLISQITANPSDAMGILNDARIVAQAQFDDPALAGRAAQIEAMQRGIGGIGSLGRVPNEVGGPDERGNAGGGGGRGPQGRDPRGPMGGPGGGLARCP